MIEETEIEAKLCDLSNELSVTGLMLEGVNHYITCDDVNRELVPTAVQYAIRTQFGRLESQVREVVCYCERD